MASPEAAAACVEVDDPLSRRLDMLEQAPSTSASAMMMPKRSPAINRSRARSTEVNRRIPEHDDRSAAFYPSRTRDSSTASTVRCRKPGGSVTAGFFARRCSDLQHDPEKWVPVFRKDHAQTKS